MKTKLALTLFICSFLLSCHNDDDNSNNEEPDLSIELTAKNNLYEGDLYKTYLENEIAITQSEIDSLQAIIDNNQGTPMTVQQLQDAQNALQDLNSMNAVQDAAEASIANIPRTPRVPPIPPQPCPSGAACMPNSIGYLSITPDVLNLIINFRDPQTQDIITSVTINQFTPLPQYNDLVAAVPLDFNGYTGSVSIQVQRTMANNANISYSLMGNIY